MAAMCATGGGLLWWYDAERRRRLESIRAGPSSGKASIGGAFGNMKLANENGRAWRTDEPAKASGGRCGSSEARGAYCVATRALRVSRQGGACVPGASGGQREGCGNGPGSKT